MSAPPANDEARDDLGGQGPHPLQVLLGIVGITAAFCAGWVLGQALFRLVGRPPGLVAFLICAVLGVACAAGLAAAVGRLFARQRKPPAFGQQILDALDRIARGDFSVRIERDARNPLADVVDSVNRMARELGTVDQQRQDFISAVSHEIQSPLTSIGGFTELLGRPDLDDATRRHYLDVIAAECARLSRVSDNLLRLTTLDDAGLDLATFRLDEQVRSVILALEPQWSVGGVDIELDAPDLTVSADQEMLQQVWINLIGNAIKFTPAQGRVRITLTRDDGAWHGEVADTGIGIGPEDLPRVFERFFRANKARSVGGSGLGLALAQRIVELHGGRIEACSAPGQGAVFGVDIPLSPR